jgi:predicted RNA binding protein YcfA (HicA-like mRNA interferase family)
MPKLKSLSGSDVVAILKSFGFVIFAQRGSHVKLKRSIGIINQTLTVPLHKEMDKGTLKAIYNQSLRYIQENDLRPHFYSE